MVLTRVVAAVAGVAVELFAFTWPEVIPALGDKLSGPITGFLTAVVMMLGVYMMFFGLTGDWLPRLTKLRDRG